jgi:hypothetical protein
MGREGRFGFRLGLEMGRRFRPATLDGSWPTSTAPQETALDDLNMSQWVRLLTRGADFAPRTLCRGLRGSIAYDVNRM